MQAAAGCVTLLAVRRQCHTVLANMLAGLPAKLRLKPLCHHSQPVSFHAVVPTRLHAGVPLTHTSVGCRVLGAAGTPALLAMLLAPLRGEAALLRSEVGR